MSLIDDITTYLDAEGWEVDERDDRTGLVLASRVAFGGTREAYTILAPEIEPDEWLAKGGGILRRFDEDGNSTGTRYLVVESKEGMPVEFQRTARSEYNVMIRTPVQLFDAAFKWDGQAGGNVASSAASRLQADGAASARERTPQPYRDLQTGEAGDDLFKELSRRFSSAYDWEEPVVLVSAPAGFGKSMLFSSLFSSTYQEFQTAKRSQRRAHRPLPILPEYSADATGPTLRGLMESFIRSDFARAVNLPTFEWMLCRGYASLMLDGLDELISRDQGFFDYLEDILTREAPVRPRILICVRDSLLGTSQGLRDFLSNAEGLVKQYALLSWGRDSVETFAAMTHKGTVRERMLKEIDRPEVLTLCGTPYYAHLVADKLSDEHIESGDLLLDETELVKDALDSIVAREYAKDLLDASVVTKEDVVAVIEDAALMELENGTRGVAIDEIVDLAQYVLPPDLSESQREQAELQFTQLSVFQSATDQGRVRFAQDVIFEYLIGQLAVGYFKSNPGRFVQLLGWRRLPPDSITMRLVRNAVGNSAGANDLEQRLVASSGMPAAFVNILQLLLKLPGGDDVLKNITLERQDLSGVHFDGVDLSGVSFKGANLESASFSDCNLAEANFSESTILHTRFDRCVESMATAELGSLAEFVSAELDGTVVEEVAEFVSLTKRSASVGRFVGPCPTAMQLRFMLLKYVRPDGKARRDWLDENGLLRGRKHTKNPMPILREAVREGLLTKDTSRGRTRYMRPRDDIYQEVVEFARALQPGEHVRRVLNATCDRQGCRHVSS